jgi:hypothetical protein
VKIVHLFNRSDLFKISNFVYDRREIVKSLFRNLEVTSFVRDTEANSEYIFQRRIHTSENSVNYNNREIIYYNINSFQLFIKLVVRYLEHLDSLGLVHANRLKS